MELAEGEGKENESQAAFALARLHIVRLEGED